MTPAELSNAFRHVAGEYRARVPARERTMDRMNYDDGVFDGIMLCVALVGALGEVIPANLAQALRDVAADYRAKHRGVRTPDRIAYDDGMHAGITLCAAQVQSLTGLEAPPPFEVPEIVH